MILKPVNEAKFGLFWLFFIRYSQNGKSSEAFKLFFEMEKTGVSPDAGTLSTVLSACGSVGALELGNWR